MRISELDIHPLLKQLLVSRGADELYPPQTAAVEKGLFNGENILMVTQTASGKTFLAVIAAINNVLMRGGKTVYLTPLKALATEIYEKLSLYRGIGVRVAITVGNYDSADPYLDRYDVIVTTYEKMDSLFRHRPAWLRRTSMFIIDEIHYINDEKRGPVLESIIANLKTSISDAQIVALSATIGNPEEIASWLSAEPVISSWRPVPLKESVYYNGVLYRADGSYERIGSFYGNAVFDLVADTIRNGGQTLVFVNSRRRAVTLAERAAKRLSIPIDPRAEEYAERVKSSSEIVFLNRKLAELISKGVCFHHAGLSYEQRKTIEEAFREGVIRVVFATPTLAAGVNLPARRVIVEDYRRYSAGEGMLPIMVLEYKQFAGRAGRPGYDEYGESVLIARRLSEIDFLITYYILGQPERITSKMGSQSSLRKHVLAFISTMAPVGLEDIRSFLKNTLYAKQRGYSGMARGLSAAIDFLRDNNLVHNEGNVFKPTPLGSKVSEVYIDPLSAVYLLKGLSKISSITVSHIVYMISASPDMPKLSVRKKDVAGLEELLNSLSPDYILGLYEREGFSYEQILSEVKTSQFLLDWIDEVPEQTISERYDVGPGDIRAYIETAEWIAYAFRRIIESHPIYKSLAERFRIVEERIKYGVREELLQLTRIPGIGRVRARRLFRAGFRDLDSLRSATPAQLMKIEGIGQETVEAIYRFLSDNPA